MKAMKAENTSWKDIAEAMGRHQGQLKARWKEINITAGNDDGKKNENGKGGEGDKEKNDKEKQNGGNGGQGKQGKKGKKGGDYQQNNNNSQKKNDNKNNNEKSNQSNKKEEASAKPSSKKEEEKPKSSSSKPASIKPTSKPASNSNNNNAANNETRFTMTDWLTLQEDDMFSFGELQCLSELIGKDLGQSWQRVAAKFFDLTGRRIHPDDVRGKFERMAVMAQGGK